MTCLLAAAKRGDLVQADVLDEEAGDEQAHGLDHQGPFDAHVHQVEAFAQPVSEAAFAGGEVVGVDVVPEDGVDRVRPDEVKAIAPATPRTPTDRAG